MLVTDELNGPFVSLFLLEYSVANSRLLLGSCWTMKLLEVWPKHPFGYVPSSLPCRPFSRATSVYGSDLHLRSFLARFLAYLGLVYPAQ